MTLPPRTDHLIDLALDEDAGLGDVTSRAIFPPTHQSTAVIEARESLVAAGLDVAAFEEDLQLAPGERGARAKRQRESEPARA